MKNHPLLLVPRSTSCISLCLVLAILAFCHPATGGAAPLRVGVASMVTPVVDGKTFAFVDPKSNPGGLYPVYLLARQGQTQDTFFSRSFYSLKSPIRSLPLRRKKYD